MSTFYLLPARDELGRRVAAGVQMWFPGVVLDPQQLAESLVASAEESSGVIALFGDELPDYLGSQLQELLEDAFGAEPGDQVIDLRQGPFGAQDVPSTWVVREATRPTPLRKVC